MQVQRKRHARGVAPGEAQKDGMGEENSQTERRKWKHPEKIYKNTKNRGKFQAPEKSKVNEKRKHGKMGMRGRLGNSLSPKTFWGNKARGQPGWTNVPAWKSKWRKRSEKDNKQGGVRYSGPRMGWWQGGNRVVKEESGAP